MHTHVPFIGFCASVRSLDDKRLNRQILECKQILNVLNGSADGYRNHPAVLMWQGHERALCLYAMGACMEWRIGRKFKTHMGEDFHAMDAVLKEQGQTAGKPPWAGDLNVCRSHRSNLIRRDPEFYGELWPNTPEAMPYLWPILIEDRYRLRLSIPDLKRFREGERKLPDWLQYDVDKHEVVVLYEPTELNL